MAELATLKHPRKVFLHIGSDKAGSTALQTHLSANNALLLEHGIYVPRFGNAPAVGHHGKFFLNFNSANVQLLVDDIDAQPAGFSVLMSWEGIHVLEEEFIVRFASLFPGCEFHIIYYVREQADLIQSGLLQQIKMQERRAVDLFKGIEIYPENRDYYGIVRKFERCFPRCRMSVTLYDRSEFTRGNIVYHFFSLLDDTLELDDITIYDNEINPSLGVDETRLLADVEEQYPQINSPEQAWKRTRLVELLVSHEAGGEKRSPYFLSEKQVRACRKHFRRSNELLIDEYGVSEKLIRANKPVWNGEDQQSPRRRSAITSQKQAELLRFADVNYMNLAFCRRYAVPLSTLLDEGWSLDEAGEHWWSGPQCRLRGAISLECYTPPKRFLRFALEGEYGEGVDARSTVSINGEVLGEFDLTSRAFLYPLERIGYPYIIELDIRHGEVSTGTASSACYQLQRFQCTAVVVPDLPGRAPFS